jgi:hypothetical protein
MAFVLFPSIIPIMPLPCSVCAIMTSSGFDVAAKMLQTSGTALILSRTLMGYAFLMIMRNVCPHAIWRAFSLASCRRSGSLPSCLTRQGPDASQKAMPNLMSGTALVSASCRSSTVLMKCAWPRMILVFSGGSILIVMKFSINNQLLYNSEKDRVCLRVFWSHRYISNLFGCETSSAEYLV